MTKFLRQNNTKGFTIIEVLVALFIFSLAVIATMAVLSRGVSSINVSKKKMTAEYLAQEGIEVVRNIRDTYALGEANPGDGWNSFLIKFNSCTTNCYFDNTAITSPTTSITFTPGTLTVAGFVKSIRVTSLTGGVRVTSLVSWDNGAKQVSFSEDLYNWIE